MTRNAACDRHEGGCAASKATDDTGPDAFSASRHWNSIFFVPILPAEDSYFFGDFAVIRDAAESDPGNSAVIAAFSM